MALTFSYTPDKDFYDSEGTYVFNSKWLAAFNPIVFKVQSDIFPTNTGETADSFLTVVSDGGRASLVLDTFTDVSIYVRGAQITVSGAVYNGVYNVLKYDLTNGRVTIDATYTATDTGTCVRYYTNYTVKLIVDAGLPIAHKWQALKPMVEIETISQRTDNNGEAVFDVSKSVQQQITTKNNLKLISLPNDINLWTAFQVSKVEQYLWFVGSTIYVETVSGTQLNGGYIELLIPTPNEFNVGEWVILSSTDPSASNAVVRIISKNTATGDITIDAEYSSYIDVSFVNRYDITRQVQDNGEQAEGNTYYAHNAKQGFNQYASNLAPKVNVEGNSDLADNLTDFTKMGKFSGMFSDFTSIMDKSMMDALTSDELPALEVVQYDENGAVIDTDYFTVTNQDEGVYRWLYTGGLTQSTLHSLNYQDENLNQVIAVTGEFVEMQVSTPFNKMLLANLTYQYSLTDSWGSPVINTTVLATFNAGMSGRPLGYIRIVSSQTSFTEGGLIVQIDYVGFETNTSAITVVMPANRLDQDIVLYCQNFQFTTISCIQAGIQMAWGVRTDDVDAVDWTTFSTLAALTSLMALNTAAKTSALKAVHLWFTEGTANTGTASKTISITGTFTDSRARGYISLLDRQNDRTFRSALDNNGKIYDGVTDRDTLNGWSCVDYNTPFTILCGFYYSSLNTATHLYNTFAYAGLKGIRIFIATATEIWFVIEQNTNDASRDRYVFTTSVKLGYNIIAMSYDGLRGANSCVFYLNGKKTIATRVAANNGNVSTLDTKKLLLFSQYVTIYERYLLGRGKIYQILNRVMTDKEARQAFIKGSLDGIAADADFLLDVNFNQPNPGTDELVVLKGTYVKGAIISVANNGSGAPRFTINGATAKSPPTTGTLIIIEGTTGSYDTALTGVAIARISDSQFDIPSQTFTVTKEGTFRVRITAFGGAAYDTFMP